MLCRTFFLLALALGPSALAEGLPDLGDASQASFTSIDERKLGEEIMREVRADRSYYDDAEATDYINALEQHKVQSYVRLDGPGVVEAGYFLGYDMKCGIGFNLTAMCIPGADKLLARSRLPLTWREQRRVLGFA